MKRVWKPVDKYIEIDAGDDMSIRFETSGEVDAVRDSGWRADNRVAISGKLPDNLRLCRAIETDDAPVPIPREAILRMAQWYEQGANDTELKEVDSVRQWLQSLGGGGQDGE